VSSVLRPVGRQPGGVYWFRRLLVLALLLAIVLVLREVFFGGASAEPASGAAATLTPTPSPSLTPTPTPTTAKATHSATPTTSAQPTACADAAIDVRVRTDATSYPPQQEPRITLSVTNTSNKACIRDIGQAALALVVYSTGQPGSSASPSTTKLSRTTFWSSDDCSPGGPHVDRTLQPGDTYAVTVQWARTAAKAHCPSGQPAAGSGAYQVIGRAGTAASKPSDFALQ
jgi:hypothetical protein